MARKLTGKPNGRPSIKTSGEDAIHNMLSGILEEKEIKFDQVLYWIEMQATAQEIASSFRISVESLDNHLHSKFGVGFSELKKKCDGRGKMSLRRYQFQQAEKNATMAIWLGKVWLGQTDTSVLVTTPQKQDEIDKDHLIMELKHEIEKLKNANEPETG